MAGRNVGWWPGHRRRFAAPARFLPIIPEPGQTYFRPRPECRGKVVSTPGGRWPCKPAGSFWPGRESRALSTREHAYGNVETSGVREPNPRHHCGITMKITQSTSKATVIVGGGLVSVVDYQGPSRWRKGGPLRSQTPTFGRTESGTTRDFGAKSRSCCDALLRSRLGGSFNGKLWCSLGWQTRRLHEFLSSEQSWLNDKQV